MEEKEHGTKDPAKLVEAEKKEHSMEKSEEKPMSGKPEETAPSAKTKLAKSTFKSMVRRMQERKLEKSTCVTALAKNLETDESKVSELWDMLEKAYALVPPSEASQQSAPPAHMKSEVEGGIKDKEAPEVPAYEDKSAKKSDEKKPMSGEADETADESVKQAPSTMKKSDSIFHEEEEVYLAKSENPFAIRTVGKTTTYPVDAFIEQSEAAQAERLAKSKFDYETTDGEDLIKGAPGARGGKIEGYTESGKPIYASTHEAQQRHKEMTRPAATPKPAGGEASGHAAAASKEISAEEAKLRARQEESKKNAKKFNTLNKADDPATQAVVDANRKQRAEDKKADAADIKDIKIQEKLSRIEDRAGHKMGMPMLKSTKVNDLIERNFDMDQTVFENARANQVKQINGAFLVKSFQEADMDALFGEQDMFKSEEKKDAKKKKDKEEPLAKPGFGSMISGAPMRTGGPTANPGVASSIATAFRKADECEDEE